MAGWLESSASNGGAWLYTPNNGRLSLGAADNSLYSLAYGINNSGQVTGYSRFAGSGGDIAFVYTPGVGRIEIPDAGTPRVARRGLGLNDQGDAVGGSFLLRSNGQLTSLQAITAGLVTEAIDINNSGSFVGGGLGNGNAYAYTPGLGVMDLGALGGNRSTAWALNDAGQVVGYAENERFRDHAFLYSVSTGMVDIGAGFGSDVMSQAYGISETGAVVGRYSPTGSGLRAFLYTQEDGAVDLNSALDPATAAEWLLVSAQGITSDGRIAGWGMHSGQVTAFVLTPVTAVPEPETYLMFTAGLALLTGAIRRRGDDRHRGKG